MAQVPAAAPKEVAPKDPDWEAAGLSEETPAEAEPAPAEIQAASPEAALQVPQIHHPSPHRHPLTAFPEAFPEAFPRPLRQHHHPASPAKARVARPALSRQVRPL